MSTKEQITQKISKIKDYLKILFTFKKYTTNEIKQDIKLKGSLERFLYLTLDSIISLMEMLIAFKEYQKPTSYSENVDILFEKKEINQNQYQLLHKMVGLRNILSHEYENLNLEILKNIINEKIIDLENLINHFENKI